MQKIIVTTEEINNYRIQLSAYPKELESLDEIVECDGNLMDALTVLAILNDEHISRSRKWLTEITGKARKIICKEEFRDELLAGSVAGLVEVLLASSVVPAGLAAPIVIFAVKTGIRNYCSDEELEEEI